MSGFVTQVSVAIEFQAYKPRNPNANCSSHGFYDIDKLSFRGIWIIWLSDLSDSTLVFQAALFERLSTNRGELVAHRLICEALQ